VKRLWPGEARAVHDSVAGALARAGGIELARRCEVDPRLRTGELGVVVESLSLDELDAAGGPDEAAAAALAARAAGAVLCPWPLVPRLAVPAALRDRHGALYLTDGEPVRLEHLDLVDRPLALDVRTGAVHEVVADGAVARMPLDPFGVPCHRGDRVAVGVEGLLELSTVLTAFWVLGALDRVVGQVAVYARDRHQFGRPIAEFGAIQWRLSDLAVAKESLAEMAAFTLLRLGERRVTPADAFALRLTTLESALTVLESGHQVLGAIGLCEEHDVTLVDRHLQPSLRRPCGLAATVTLLADAVAEHGFDAIRPITPLQAATG
jgi:alkylation response protein AidB-like acyl-CoA dehydrogenase